MTPLRQKMIDLMSFRQFSPKTHKAYLAAVTKLTTYYHRSPEQITLQEIKSWLIEAANKQNWSPSTVHQITNGLKFCYHQVLEQPDFLADISLPKRPQKIPLLLTQKEVYAILQSTTNLKHLTLLSLCYGCGLRVSELVALTRDDIDSERFLLRVVQGKGKKDRNIPLSESLLNLLRAYWQVWHPNYHLFFSYQQKKVLGISTAQKIFTRAKLKSGIHKKGGIHSLRHAYATHQLERGLPIHQLQQFLGHKDINLTLRYLHWVPGSDGQASDLLAHFIVDDVLMKTKQTLEVPDECF